MSAELERNKTFDLAFPFDYKGETITEITLRRPKMSDVKKMTASKQETLSATMEMVADLAGKPIALFDELDATDYKPMQDWTSKILGKP